MDKEYEYWLPDYLEDAPDFDVTVYVSADYDRGEAPILNYSPPDPGYPASVEITEIKVSPELPKELEELLIAEMLNSWEDDLLAKGNEYYA